MSSEMARTRKAARCTGAEGLSIVRSSILVSSASKPSTSCAGLSGSSISSESNWQTISRSRSRRSSASSTAARTNSSPHSSGKLSSCRRRRTSSASLETRYSSMSGSSWARRALGSMSVCIRPARRVSASETSLAGRSDEHSCSGQLSMSRRVSSPSSTASARKCAISDVASGVSRLMSSSDWASDSKPAATCAEVRMPRTWSDEKRTAISSRSRSLLSIALVTPRLITCAWNCGACSSEIERIASSKSKPTRYSESDTSSAFLKLSSVCSEVVLLRGCSVPMSVSPSSEHQRRARTCSVTAEGPSGSVSLGSSVVTMR
mmetsp:Transcript_50821/g.108516  ORF Transcript_50821/g.108516 Transcript_50821/m.108516 type:complete len:319 (-) Transcript_50821:83-1039(-)